MRLAFFYPSVCFTKATLLTLNFIRLIDNLGKWFVFLVETVAVWFEIFLNVSVLFYRLCINFLKWTYTQRIYCDIESISIRKFRISFLFFIEVKNYAFKQSPDNPRTSIRFWGFDNFKIFCHSSIHDMNIEWECACSVWMGAKLMRITSWLKVTFYAITTTIANCAFIMGHKTGA